METINVLIDDSIYQIPSIEIEYCSFGEKLLKKVSNNVMKLSFTDIDVFNRYLERLDTLKSLVYLDSDFKRIIDSDIISEEMSLIESFEEKYGIWLDVIHFDTWSLNSISDNKIKVIINYSLDGEEYQKIEETISVSDMKSSFEISFLFVNLEEIEKLLKKYHLKKYKLT